MKLTAFTSLPTLACGLLLLAAGCGPSNMSGVAEGPDEEPPPLTAEEEAGEEAYNRTAR